MDLDTQRIRELLDQRDTIEAELTAIFAGKEVKERKPQRCSLCLAEGHSQRTCPKREDKKD